MKKLNSLEVKRIRKFYPTLPQEGYSPIYAKMDELVTSKLVSSINLGSNNIFSLFPFFQEAVSVTTVEQYFSSPGLTQKQAIARAASATAFLLNTSATGVLKLLSDSVYWYSFTPGEVFNNTTPASRLGTFSHARNQINDSRITLKPGTSWVNLPKISDTGALLNQGKGLSFNASQLAAKPYTIITFARPASIIESYVFNTGLIGSDGTPFSGIRLSLVPCDLPANSASIIGSGSALLGNAMVFNNNVNQNAVKVAVGNSSLTFNSNIPINTTSPFFLTVTADAAGLKIHENDTEIGGSTGSYLMSNPGNLLIGEQGDDYYPFKGDYYDAILFDRALSLQQARTVRVFLNFLRDLRVYERSNRDYTEGLRYKAFAIGNQTANDTRQWNDYRLGTSINNHPNEIEGIAVAPDGVVYTTSYYDESGRRVSVFKDGKMLGGINNGNLGGEAIALDSTYFYYTFITADATNTYYKLQRINRALTNGLYPFNPFNPTPGAYSSDIVVGQRAGAPDLTIDIPNSPKGIDVSATEIFLAEPREGKIKVYNLSTGAFVREWVATSSPGKLALSPDKTKVWVCQSDRVVRYSPTGTIEATITLVSDPVALCFSPVGRLIIASHTNIYILNTGETSIAQEFGNGSLFNPARGVNVGVLADGYWDTITDVKLDAAGNIYVSEEKPGTSTLSSYNFTTGQLNWRTFSSFFVDSATFDPDDSNTLYNAYYKFTVNPDQGTWQRVATHFNPAFAGDIRADNAGDRPKIVKIAGRRFLTLAHTNDSALAIYRFDSTLGETSIPCANINFTDGTSINVWIDANGTGTVTAGETTTVTPPQNLYLTAPRIDPQGNLLVLNPESRTVYPIYILKYDFTGFNGIGAPTWNFASPQQVVFPNSVLGSPSNIYATVKRFSFSNDGKQLIAGSYSQEYTSGGVSGFSFGNTVQIFNYNASANTIQLVSSFNVPYGSEVDGGTVQAKYLKLVKDRIVVGYIQNYYPVNKELPLFRIYKTDGTLIGKIGYIPAFTNYSWLDINYPFDAVASGKQLFIVSEDVTFARNQFTIVDLP